MSPTFTMTRAWKARTMRSPKAAISADLGIDRETGSLKPGKWADITLFDDEIEVKRTFLKGRQIYRA